MQFVKASERLPELWVHNPGSSKRIHLRKFGMYPDFGRYVKTETEEYFLLSDGVKFEKDSFQHIEWLDESTPASIEEKAKALYPDVDESTDYASDDYRLNEVKKFQRQAHITCAGMYTGEIAAAEQRRIEAYNLGIADGKHQAKCKSDIEIETLKAENSKMRKALEEVRKLTNMLLFGQPTPPEATEFISDIEVIATEALNTTP